MGLEPTRPCGHWILSPARLPFRHFGLVRILEFTRCHARVKRSEWTFRETSSRNRPGRGALRKRPGNCGSPNDAARAGLLTFPFFAPCASFRETSRTTTGTKGTTQTGSQIALLRAAKRQILSVLPGFLHHRGLKERQDHESAKTGKHEIDTAMDRCLLAAVTTRSRAVFVSSSFCAFVLSCFRELSSCRPLANPRSLAAENCMVAGRSPPWVLRVPGALGGRKGWGCPGGARAGPLAVFSGVWRLAHDAPQSHERSRAEPSRLRPPPVNLLPLGTPSVALEAFPGRANSCVKKSPG